MSLTLLTILSGFFTFFVGVTVPLWILTTVRKNNAKLEADSSARHAEHKKMMEALSLIYEKLDAIEAELRNSKS